MSPCICGVGGTAWAPYILHIPGFARNGGNPGPPAAHAQHCASLAPLPRHDIVPSQPDKALGSQHLTQHTSDDSCCNDAGLECSWQRPHQELRARGLKPEHKARRGTSPETLASRVNKGMKGWSRLPLPGKPNQHLVGQATGGWVTVQAESQDFISAHAVRLCAGLDSRAQQAREAWHGDNV